MFSLSVEQVQHAESLCEEHRDDATNRKAAIFRLQLELLSSGQHLRISEDDNTYVSAIIPFEAHYVTIQITISPSYNFEVEQNLYHCWLRYCTCCDSHHVDIDILCQKAQNIYDVYCAANVGIWVFRERHCFQINLESSHDDISRSCLEIATSATQKFEMEAQEQYSTYPESVGLPRLEKEANSTPEQRAVKTAITKLLDRNDFSLDWRQAMTETSADELMSTCVAASQVPAETDSNIRNWYKQLFTSVWNGAIRRNGPQKKIPMDKYARVGFKFVLQLAAHAKEIWGQDGYVFFIAFMGQNLPISSVKTIGRVNNSYRDEILKYGRDLLEKRECPRWEVDESKLLSQLLSPLALIDYLLISGFTHHKIYAALYLEVDTSQPGPA